MGRQPRLRVGVSGSSWSHWVGGTLDRPAPRTWHKGSSSGNLRYVVNGGRPAPGAAVPLAIEKHSTGLVSSVMSPNESSQAACKHTAQQPGRPGRAAAEGGGGV
jgi:hypothetical protein